MAWNSVFKKPKRDPELDLRTFVDELQRLVAAQLTSVVVFGSLASGEFHADHSDVNTMIFLRDMSYSKMVTLTPALKAWAAKGHPAPIILRLGELAAVARSLPIEFLDAQNHHRVILGEDPFKDLTINTDFLRAQCEHEISVTTIKLRQGAILAAADPKKIRELLIQSLPSVLAIYRGILRLQEKNTKMNKIEAAERLAGAAGLDAQGLRRLHDFRFSRKTDNVEVLLTDYLDGLEKASHYLRSL